VYAIKDRALRLLTRSKVYFRLLQFNVTIKTQAEAKAFTIQTEFKKRTNLEIHSLQMGLIFQKGKTRRKNKKLFEIRD